jgi:hypothetical protein
MFYSVPESGACPFQQSTMIENGNIVQRLQYTSCIQETRTVFLRPDGREDHTEIQFRFPDPAPEGSTQSATVGPTQTSADARCPRLMTIFTQQVDHTLPAGDTARYVRERDTQCTPTRRTDDTETWRGDIAFQGRPAASFALRRVSDADALEMTLRDGARFTLQVPIQPNAVPLVPDFTRETTGSYAIGDERLEFRLRGQGTTPRAWSRWTLTAPGGITGEFDLNPDFSGSGRFRRGEVLDSLLVWNRRGEATVTLVSGEATTAGPSAAALEFLTHTWRALFAAGVR